MDYLAASRNQVLKALASGEPVTREQAERFPDLVLDPDASRIPDWLLPLIRRPSPPNGPRYVVADGKPFHVSLNAAGPLVTEVELFNSGSVRKVCHNPYAPTPDKVKAAVAAYETVCKFVKNPEDFRGRFSGSDLAELDASQVPTATAAGKNSAPSSAGPELDSKTVPEPQSTTSKPQRRPQR